MAGQQVPTTASGNTVQTMAQALVTAISRELSAGHSTPVSTSVRPPYPSLNTTTPSSNSTVLHSNTITDTSAKVNEALKRQFPNMFKSKTEAKKGKGRFARTVPIKCTELTVCVLPAPTTVTPKSTVELQLTQAGLGKKAVSVPEDYKHEDIVTIMEEEFPKLRPIQGRWMLYKATGGSGQRKLSLVTMDSEGYSGRQLRSVSNSGKNILFLVPLQEEMDTQPLPYNSAEFSKMPKVPCVTCNTTMPLQMLALHAEECQLNSNKNDIVIVENESEDDNTEEVVTNTAETKTLEDSLGMCPICQKELPMSVLPYHCSLCADRSFSNDKVSEDDIEQPGPSSTARMSTSSEQLNEEWKTVENPQEAVRLFLEQLREGGKRQPSLLLSLDARDTDEERDRSLISFYKQRREKQQWAAPFSCHIQGDAAIGIGVTRHILSTTIAKLKHGFKLNCGNAAETTLFEGEIDHLLPTASAVLLESDLLVMAGRMIGHSLINQGPALSGLSLAIVYSLTSGTKDTATTKLCLEDCPDIEQRETIRLLLKDEWTEEETSRVNNLCLEWYFTVPNKTTNKMLLFQQLLSHAVIHKYIYTHI
nr:uncharacterized protein LOC129441489 [Misgurnus anguillicaudatus]